MGKNFCKTSIATILITAIFISGSFLFYLREAKAAIPVSIVGPDVPNLVQNTIRTIKSVSTWVKEFVLDTLAWTFANMAIDQMTKQTVNWINSGFQGNPLFVTNPGDFLRDAADQASGIFFNELGLTNLCAPFRVRIELALRTQMPFQRRMQCTLSRVINNIENFENDFLAGGWAGWIAMTQSPQNNIYGAYLESADELARRQEQARNSATMEAGWGKGFLSKKGDCLELQKLPKGVQGPPQCLRYDIITPGSTIQDRLGVALGADFGRLQVADEINEILGALINQFISSALRNLRGGAGGGGGGGSGSGMVEKPPESLKNNVREMINGAINQENTYRQSKQDSLDTIGDIKTALDNLGNCLGIGTDPRKADYESKKTDIEGDIRNSVSLILEATTDLLDNIDASTYEELQKITDDFNNIMQPRMHSPYEIGAAAEEYGALKGELEQINIEYQQCLESKESASSTP